MKLPAAVLRLVSTEPLCAGVQPRANCSRARCMLGFRSLSLIAIQSSFGVFVNLIESFMMLYRQSMATFFLNFLLYLTVFVCCYGDVPDDTVIYFTRFRFRAVPVANMKTATSSGATIVWSAPPALASSSLQMASVTLHSYSIKNSATNQMVSFVANVVMNTNIGLSGLSCFDDASSLFYFLPTPSFPSFSSTAELMTTVQGSARNTLFISNVRSRRNAKTLLLQTNATIWCLKWDSSRKAIIALTDVNVLVLSPSSGAVLLETANPWIDAFGNTFASPKDGLCSYDSANAQLFFAAASAPMRCELIARLPVFAAASAEWGPCLTESVVDLQAVAQLRTVSVVLADSVGKFSFAAYNPYGGGLIRLAVLPDTQPLVGPGMFNPNTMMHYVVQSTTTTGFDHDGTIGQDFSSQYIMSSDVASAFINRPIIGSVNVLGFDTNFRKMRVKKEVSAMELLPAAGIVSARGVSFQIATVYPLDWTRSTDTCGGFWTSSCFSTLGFANSISDTYDPFGLYSCPVNWYAASECEVRAIFSKSPCSQLSGDNMCGRQNSRYLGTNMQQFLYRFGDSGFTRSALNTSQVQQASSIISADTGSSWAGMVCRQEYGITKRPIDWMYRGDFCGGFRMSGCSNRVFFAASMSNVFNPGARYLCPTGYRWMNSCEAQRAFSGCTEYVYTSFQCPVSTGTNKFSASGDISSATPNNPQNRYFRFSDSRDTALALDAFGKHLACGSTKKLFIYAKFCLQVGRPGVVALSDNQFAGIVCVEEVVTGTESQQDLLASGFIGNTLGLI